MRRFVWRDSHPFWSVVWAGVDGSRVPNSSCWRRGRGGSLTGIINRSPGSEYCAVWWCQRVWQPSAQRTVYLRRLLRTADGRSESPELTLPATLSPGLDFSRRGGMTAHEVNFDGLVGLTHRMPGYRFGAMRHRPATVFRVSNPRLAVKQGLLKMKALADAGFPGR